MGMLGFYLDSVDTKAFQNVETDYASREAPILPLLAPWLIAGPLLYLIKNQTAWFYMFSGASIMSVSGYAAMSWYYYRAKQRHRRLLGIPDWREKLRQKVQDDMAKLD